MPLKDEKETTTRISNKSSNEVDKQKKKKLLRLRQKRSEEAAIRISNSSKKESKAPDDVRKKQKGKLLRLRQDRQRRADETAIRTTNSNGKDSKSLRIGRQQYRNVGSPRTTISKTNFNKESTTAAATTTTTTSTTTPSVQVGAVAVRAISFEDDDAVEDFSTDDDTEGNGDFVARHLRQTSSSTDSDRDNDSITNNDVQMNSIEMCSSSSSSSSQLQLSCDSDSQLPTASPVDMDALKAQYKVASRGSILQRMKAEMTVADEIVENNNNVRSISKLHIMVSTVASIIIAIVIGVVVTSTKKQKGMDKKHFPPTTSPTLSNFINLQEHMKSISGDTVFDDSTPQYKALSWLTYEDAWMPNILTKRDYDDELVDRYILAVVYFSTGGSNWLNDLNFLTNSSVCDWNQHYSENEGGVISHGNRLSYGVHCDNRGVTKILLDRNNLNGTIPFEIGTTLKYIHEISIANNYLYGTIPSSFGNLVRLEFFEVSSNVLSGTIPNSFSQLTKLEYFSTRSNHLTGPIPSGITNLESLERLDLSVNKLTGSIPEFSLRNSLEYLSIFNNVLDGPLPESLVELSNLEVINLSENFLTGIIPSRLGMLEKLSYLIFSHNDISGSIPISIGNLDVLGTFALDSNSLIGSIPSEIGKLTKLRHVNLSKNNLSGTIPTELGQCNKMIWIILDNNPQISGTIPLTLSSLYKLESLRVQNTGITGSLDTIVCPRLITASSDCGGLSAKVNCTCCITCCDPISGMCQEDTDKQCHHLEYIASAVYGYTADCTCRGLYHGFTCNLEECLACNEDNTVCGTGTTLGINKISSHIANNYHNLFQYTVGRNESILWSETPERDCNVSINGQQCNRCSLYYCRDGFPARHIDCTNLVDVVDGGVYDTCQHYKKGGVLEYISWWDTFSWTGCLPFYYRPLQ